MVILAFGAHPDDIEFGCGGVLINEVKKGNQVHVVCLTKGEAGTAGTPAQREKETKQAAKIMGVQLEFFNVGGDCHVEYTLKNKIMIARKIRQVRPEIVLAPDLNENQHPDHSTTAKLVRDASRLARYGGLKELKKLKPHTIGALYFYAGNPLTPTLPDIIIDVTDVMAQWKKAMQAHASQVGNKKYIEVLESRARFLGLSSGTEYAIGFWKNSPIRLQGLEQITKTARNF